CRNAGDNQPRIFTFWGDMKALTHSFSLLLFVCVALSSCSTPQPGPDKTVAGALLGAGWGAGAGAVIGNQVTDSTHNPEGSGAAIGAGFGLVQGALIGAGYDMNESDLMDQREELDALRVSNTVNQRHLERIQGSLEPSNIGSLSGGIYQVFFDVDATSLRAGAIANLETIADAFAGSPQAVTVHVDGHSDDSGLPEYNQRLAEARAKSVTAYLLARGISVDQIKVSSYGSLRPIASNSTSAGRQLNRRVDIYVTNSRG
ncbi:MAG: OmpA family protein, partial [Bdellovibrionales bacterium]|nr:OmpA family protein [Bdellovibrionales bacterium]